jgi:hypothetical protein
MKYLYIILMMFLFASCHKNEQNKTMRKLLFLEDADPFIKLAKDYGAIQSNQKELILNEQFTNNSNSWNLFPELLGSNASAKIEIDNSLYLVGDVFNTNAITKVFINKILNETKSFEIEFAALWLEHSQENSSNLLLSGVNKEIILNLKSGFNNSISFKNSNGISTSFASKNFANNNTEYTIFTIRKVGKSILLFVNKNLEGVAESESFEINSIGFETLRELKIDYLLINYLNL